MAAGIWKVSTSNAFNTTLDGSITSSATTILLTSVTALQAPGVLVIDRVDPTTGTSTPLVREYVSFTGISGNNITGATRGLGGSTNQAHSSGAKVEEAFSITHWNDMLDALANAIDLTDGTLDLTKVVSLAGTQTMTNKTMTSPALTTPKITTSINDSGGNEVIKTPATASAVNEITVTNSATGNAVQVAATGGDTNIELKLASKGAKEINISTGYYQGLQAYTPAGGATATLDLSLGNDHRITMPAGNITIALSNEQVGQKFLVSITQDGTGSRTVTWFTTIKWAGGSAPTLTTTGSKRDTFGFVVTGSGTYDGFVVGQNL